MALTDEAIDKIKGMITSGELGPGDRLPKEADLAERLGLSRNSLREAVKALSMIRVLDVRQGDGTYVTSLAQRVAGQPEPLGEVRLLRQPVPRAELTGGDHAFDLVDCLVGQCHACLRGGSTPAVPVSGPVSGPVPSR